ncbi:hypothetical protein Poli38472_004462 [Pythium oligandrum]|uniref:Uncharacterized protein n=1 Tax=Pythium oligandrum TaxID=41045 RepID=A0A8K1CB15_PYTOL|nr:hypothetical protein Poli38472_004462 [Pythium oligandrum]|eukprot:TMW59393.1 hypothetical protein Poli38472_004462 [Pythium oligandrum]
MWKSYFDGCDFWIFVFDLSDPAQFAGAVIEFFNIMSVENMHKKPKLLLLNKMDACFTIEDSLVRSYLMLDRLMTDAFSASTPSGPMHVVKMSAFTGENIDSVLRWIQQRWNQSGTANTANGGPSTAHVSHQSKTERQRVHPVGQ